MLYVMQVKSLAPNFKHLVIAVADGEVEGLCARGAAAALAAELHRLHVLVQQQQWRLVHVEERPLQRVQVPVVRLLKGSSGCSRYVEKDGGSGT